MDCKKTQQLLDDLTHERLAPATAAQARQHLADCTDCRVMEQRTGRLQRLLALKRYERPAPEYFDHFLSEFHGRLLTEARQIGWWERALGRVDDFLAAESMRVWRYSFSSASDERSRRRCYRPGGCGQFVFGRCRCDASSAAFHTQYNCRVTPQPAAGGFGGLPARVSGQRGFGFHFGARGFLRAALHAGSPPCHTGQL
jgi:hypothetical protein